jgi:hypothetical protein
MNKLLPSASIPSGAEHAAEEVLNLAKMPEKRTAGALVDFAAFVARLESRHRGKQDCRLLKTKESMEVRANPP